MRSRQWQFKKVRETKSIWDRLIKDLAAANPAQANRDVQWLSRQRAQAICTAMAAKGLGLHTINILTKGRRQQQRQVEIASQVSENHRNRHPSAGARVRPRARSGRTSTRPLRSPLAHRPATTT